jgi:hypothetical protein
MEKNIGKIQNIYHGIPEVRVHSSNASASAKMQAAITSFPRTLENWLINVGYDWCDEHKMELVDCVQHHPWE